MAMALNLRGALAKLSDAELAERLGAAWSRYDNLPRGWFRPLFSLPGPIRHPRIYRFIMGMNGMSSGHWVDWLLPLVLSSKLTDNLMDSINDPDLIVCEIRDLTDEIERRVNSRKGRNT